MNYKILLLALTFMIPNSTCNADALELAQEITVGAFIGIGVVTTAAIGYIAAKYPREIKEVIKNKTIIQETIKNKNNIKDFAINKGSELYVSSLIKEATQNTPLSLEAKTDLTERINLTAATFYHNAQTSDDKTQAEIFKKYGDKLYNLLPALATEGKKEPLRNFLDSTLKSIGTCCHYLGGTKAQYSSKFSQKYAALLHRLGDASYRYSSNINNHNGILAKPLDTIDLNNNAHLVGTIVATTLATYVTYKIIKKLVYNPAKRVANKIIGNPTEKTYNDTIEPIKEEENLTDTTEKKISARRTSFV